jgi:hypothetical protein
MGMIYHLENVTFNLDFNLRQSLRIALKKNHIMKQYSYLF